jgi:regulatory subunit for Cdc7p protein kinase
MVKEYERATHQNEVPAWPILHGSFLRISEPALENTIPIPELREHAWKTWVERDESHTGGAGASGTLSRSISSTSLNQEKISQEPLIPYQAASGNSVVLTSTIASTSNAHMSGGTPNGAHGFIGNGAAAYAQGKDKRVIDMTKRVQVLKRNFMRNGGGNSEPSNTAVEAPSPRSQATAKPAPVERAESEESDDTVGDYMPEVAADERDERAHQVETGDDTEETQSKRDASPPARQMNQVVRDRVLRMLRKSRKGTPMPPSVQRIHWELKGLPGRLHLKRAHGNEVTRKPGYCENCRVKFDDFDTVSTAANLMRWNHRPLIPTFAVHYSIC